jgi:hypothetical protein
MRPEELSIRDAGLVIQCYNRHANFSMVSKAGVDLTHWWLWPCVGQAIELEFSHPLLQLFEDVVHLRQLCLKRLGGGVEGAADFFAGFFELSDEIAPEAVEIFEGGHAIFVGHGFIVLPGWGREGGW